MATAEQNRLHAAVADERDRWRARAEAAEAERDRLRRTLMDALEVECVKVARLTKALRALSDGRWYNGSYPILSASEFAREALASLPDLDTPQPRRAHDVLRDALVETGASEETRQRAERVFAERHPYPEGPRPTSAYHYGEPAAHEYVAHPDVDEDSAPIPPKADDE